MASSDVTLEIGDHGTGISTGWTLENALPSMSFSHVSFESFGVTDLVLALQAQKGPSEFFPFPVFAHLPVPKKVTFSMGSITTLAHESLQFPLGFHTKMSRSDMTK